LFERGEGGRVIDEGSDDREGQQAVKKTRSGTENGGWKKNVGRGGFVTRTRSWNGKQPGKRKKNDLRLK